MRIIVCIKRLTDYAADRTLPKSPTNFRVKVNPQDLVALEEALTLRQKLGGEVIALSLGTPTEEVVLRRGLTTGADRAVLVEHSGQIDWPVTSLVLAKAAREIGFDLILCGTRHLDQMEEAVGPGLAEYLGVPVVTNAVRVEVLADGRTLRVSSRLPGGMRQTCELGLPGVVAVAEGLNQPRYVPILGRDYRQGLSKPVEHWPLADLRIDPAALRAKVKVVAVGEMKLRVRLGVKVAGLSLEDKLRLLGLGTAEATDKKGLIIHDPRLAADQLLKKLAEWRAEE